ncbi:two component transcriptional regulator, LuxR family [Devosia lucknowensis]|uniref:Two component transcriptional regulator, LuxR family n=1 Tax=Devosia lucknowensis TaxID=1096929 RepID=A0A1Y6FCA6_9HYPH|nr:DNA-binding response regulator [Devosia lucknowensis]SMQ70083.1 two component transcriptional regulator, LuxR family [Devosia lucknowensis]
MSRIEKEQDIVLLVDDSPEALGFLTSALEDAGVTVLVARSGEAALGIVARITPDVVLMDAVMPGLDGFETCQRMKALAPLAHVPVIFMTGLTETEHIVHALESGGVDYLSKPINVDELRARIRVHLANARRAQSARIALDAAGRHLVAFARDGGVLWSTPQATRLLDRAGVNAAGQPDMSQRFTEWQATHDEAGVPGGGFDLGGAGGPELQFAFLGLVGGEEYLFRLSRMQAAGEEDALRQHFGTTARESDVLLWIARGKSNKDIGDILGLSPRTVNKHLEQVYAKLGVENRASAAIKAIQALQAFADL